MRYTVRPPTVCACFCVPDSGVRDLGPSMVDAATLDATTDEDASLADASADADAATAPDGG
jgi:hypothetical protein